MNRTVLPVLVVEDDQDQLELRSLLLGRSGFDVIQADNRDSALAIATERKPGIAVLDLRLPTEDDGLGLIRDLKTLDSTMRLLVLTGSDPARLRQRPEGQMVDEICKKPVTSGRLVEVLRGLADTN